MGLNFNFPKLNLGNLLPKTVGDVLHGSLDTLKKGAAASFQDIIQGKTTGLLDRALNFLPGHKSTNPPAIGVSNAPEANYNAAANLLNVPSYPLPPAAARQAARTKGAAVAPAAAAGISPALMIAGGVGVLGLVGLAFFAGRK